MRLRKFLDARFDEGRAHALGGRRRSPVHWGEPGARVEPYARWAYEAGYREGLAALDDLAEALGRRVQAS